MHSVKLITSELTWCLRCSMRLGRKQMLVRSVSSPVNQRRFYTADIMPSATLEGEQKTYAPKIQQLVKDISQLTLIEVADLNELLKKTLKISDAPMMAMGAMSAAKPKEEDEEAPKVKQEKVNFTVRITKFEDSKKIALVKEIKTMVEGLNLVQAKKFVESVPQTVRADIPKEEAEKLKASLEAVGATVVLE
jgi:large subunit ribosomal protein L7/L12